MLALPSAMLAADASGAVVAAAVPVAPSVVAQPAVQPPREQSAAPRPMASVEVGTEEPKRLQSMLQRPARGHWNE